MTFEAVKVELTNSTGFPRRFTCASNAAITKGTLLVLSDPRTAAAHSTTGSVPCAGIALEGVSGVDNVTSISAWTDGVFEMKCSGAINVGDAVKLGTTPNCVIAAGAESNAASGAVVLGYALETGINAEVINVRVKL